VRLLDIYLDDHWAGAAAGSALARRLADENADSPWALDLAWIADQIRNDQQTLAEIRRRLHCKGGGLKKAAALIGERVARLKPNGRLVRYSPLSRVLEVEALISGISAKLRLWRALQAFDESDGLLDDCDLEELVFGAEAQLDLLSSIHEAVSKEAFGAIGNGAASGS